MGKESVAIDISPLSVEVMQARGLDARLVNLFDTHFAERFDTILMLMNGSGIIGRVENFGDFFQRMKLLLNPGGCILMDSSDLRYLFEEEMEALSLIWRAIITVNWISRCNINK